MVPTKAEHLKTGLCLWEEKLPGDELGSAVGTATERVLSSNT